MDEDRLTTIERGIADLKTMFEQRFDAVDQRFDAVDRRFVQMQAEMDRRFDETQSQLKTLIEDVRDDVRIVLEGHVALEARVTKLERRKR
jgi:hypothetical protein